MKKIYMLVMAMIGFVAGNAQSNSALTVKENNSLTKETTKGHQYNSTDKVILWEDDCSDASTWDLANQNTGGLDVDWAISTNPEDIPVSVLSPFESATASNGFFFINSDANNITDFDGTTIDVTATNNTPIDLTGYDNVLLQFSHNYRWWHDTRIVRVSGDGGATWTEFQCSDVDGYQNFDFGSGEQNSGNPQLESIDISAIAGGQSDVKVQFAYNDNDYWAWYWAFDDVSIVEKPANDVQIEYSVVSQIPQTGIEYGRVPVSQLESAHYFEAFIVNFGTQDQHNVTMNVEFNNDDSGVPAIEFNENIGTLASGDTTTLVYAYTDPLAPGVYTGTFTLTSDEETGGDNFYNNVDNRIFEITQGETAQYSLDGVGVYDNPVVGNFRLGNFNDNGNPATLGAFLNEYQVKEGTVLTGLRVMLGTSADIAGSVVYAIFADTTDVLNNDVSSALTAGEEVTISDADVAQGYVDLMFFAPYTVDADNMYYAGVFINDGENFAVIDDNTIPQPSLASAFFIENTTYSNGNAFAIRLLTVGTPVSVSEIDNLDFSVEQNIPNPANGITTVNYNLKNSAVVSFELVDLTGKVVLSRQEGRVAAGEHNIVIDVKNLSAGIYTYNLTVGNQSVSKKLIIE